MERTLIAAGGATLAAIIAFTGTLVAWNPVDARTKRMDRELAKIRPMSVDFPKPNWDFDAWHESIVGKETLWKEIVAPPPPPPPKPPDPPDPKEILQGVECTRMQIGDKAKIKTPDNPKGSMYKVGDTIKGVSIKEINRKYVLFSLMYEGKELTLMMDRQ